MSEQNKETAVFWVPWGIGPVCAILAVAASGWPQMLGEGYLSFMALLNAALAVAAVNSSRFAVGAISVMFFGAKYTFSQLLVGIGVLLFAASWLPFAFQKPKVRHK